MRRGNPMVVALAAVTVLLLAAVVLVAPMLLHPPLSAASLRGIPAKDRIQLQQEQAKLQESSRLLLLQALGGFLLLAGAAATWRQVQVSREGQITDHFTRAVEQLGSDSLDVRLGGVYALERIALNSADDRPTITEILTAFIRGHAPYPAGSPEDPRPHPDPVLAQKQYLRDRGAADVQAALTVLGRRTPTPDDALVELSMVDLSRCYLTRARLDGIRIRHANLSGAWMRQISLERADLNNTDLRGAAMTEANLTGTNLEHAYLDHARLYGARLRSARLLGASLRGADLRAATLSRADLRNADLAGADLRDADLHDASLQGANLQGASLDGASLHNCRADDATRWPDGFDTDRCRAEGVILPTAQPTEPGVPPLSA